MKELEGASKGCSPSTAPSQDIVGVNRYSVLVFCQPTGKYRGAKWALQSPICFPDKFLPPGIWAGLKLLQEEDPLI